MTITKRLSGAAAFAILLLAASPLRAQDQGSMDHAAMASSYQEEAKAAEAKAASHQQELDRLKKTAALPKGSGTTKAEMVKHCEQLVKAYKQAGAQASDLAKLHQKAAKATK